MKSGQILCEHLFVTAEGSAYTRLRRALDRRNAPEALAAASELPHVGLRDALELCLLLLEHDRARFERAALRWHGRYCREVAEVSLDEAQAILASLAALRTPRATNAALALGELLSRRGQEQVAEAVIRWATARVA